MMALSVGRTVDPELGTMRYCRRCDEWWPEDAEFWAPTKRGPLVCRACQREWNRKAHDRRLARVKPVVVAADPETRYEPVACVCKACDGCLTVTPFLVCRFCRRHHQW